MSRLRFTLRRGGLEMATLYVPHHLSRESLAEVLCSSRKDDDPANLPELSAAATLSEVRTELIYRGDLWWAWSDQLSEDEADHLREWAQRQVVKL